MQQIALVSNYKQTLLYLTLNRKTVSYGIYYSSKRMVRRPRMVSGLVLMTSKRKGTGIIKRLTFMRIGGTGQPNDIINADCAALNLVYRTWNAQYCTNLRFAACERPVNTATPVFCTQTGDDGRLTTQCPFRHVMKELPGTGVISCGKACRSEPRCRSFNLLEQGGGKMVCQLNNATRHEAAEGDMKEKENCYFYDL